jgi:hypothetical protein
LANTNIGLPYWDWTKDSSVPDVWENIQSPIKDHLSIDYNWSGWSWDKMLSVCNHNHNGDPLSGPQTHALRIRKKDFQEAKRNHVIETVGPEKFRKMNQSDPFSQLLQSYIEDALQEKSYEGFISIVSKKPHALIHMTLQCTTAYPTTTAYGLRYAI